MKNGRKRTIAIILLVFVLLLGGAGIYVAYLLRSAVVPTAPTSIPRAAEWYGGGGCNVSFTVVVAPTATPSATVTPAVCRGACSGTIGCASGMTCVEGVCRNSTCSTTDNQNCECPVVTASPTGTATATVAVTATASPTVTLTATPVATRAATPTATPTVPVLPEAGILNLPGAAAFGGGLLLVILGILFAL